MSRGFPRWGAMLGSCGTGLSSELSSCRLHEVSCAGLQKGPAGLVDCCLRIQLLFPTSCMPLCLWPCGLGVREGGIAYRVRQTVGRRSFYGPVEKPPSTLSEDSPPCLLGDIPRAPVHNPHPCFEVSTMDSFVP